MYPSYGLYQASSSAVDVLTVVFGAKILQGTTSNLGLLDAASNFGFIFASFGFGYLTRRLAPSRPLLAASLALCAIPVFLFAATGTMGLAYVVALLIGATTAVPNSALPWYLCQQVPRSRWGEVFGKLSAVGALGGALGTVFAFGWLFAVESWGLGGAEHGLFVTFGVATLLSALGIWYAVGTIPKERGTNTAKLPRIEDSATRRIVGSALDPSPASVFRDVWVVYTVLPAILFLGIGMSYTASVLYLLQGLGLSSGAVFAFVLLFRLASWSTSNPTGHLVAKFTPLRLHQMASVWRILSVLGIAMLALTPVGVWSLAAAAALFALCGATHGAFGVTGPSTSTDPVPERHQGMAIGLFNGVSVGAAGVGAWLAGVFGQEFGFAVVLAISAGIMAAALWLHQRY